MKKKCVTVIIPVFNEAESIPLVVDAVHTQMEKAEVDYKMLFIDDGSKDTTYKVLDQIRQQDDFVEFVSFSRNFGKEAALFAGLEHTDSDAVIIMDADLQHPPEVIPQMINLWLQSNYDIVDAVKTSRGKFNPFHKMASFFFNRIMRVFTQLDMRGASDFKLLDRTVIDTLLECREYNRFFRGLTEWVGFHHTQIGFVVAKRQKGSSQWSLFGLIKYSVNNIIAFSAIPLRMISALGVITIILALALGIQTFVLYLRGETAEGFTTVLLSLAFFSGTILLSLGVIGEYLSRMFDEIKSRPIYIKRSGRSFHNEPTKQFSVTDDSNTTIKKKTDKKRSIKK